MSFIDMCALTLLESNLSSASIVSMECMNLFYLPTQPHKELEVFKKYYNSF